MKFNCHEETWSEEKARRAQWRRKFALLPVQVKGGCRWLEFVEGREVYCSGYEGFFAWEYRECS